MYIADKINLKGKGIKFVENYMKRNHYTFNFYDEENNLAEYVKNTAGITVAQITIIYNNNMRVKEVR